MYNILSSLEVTVKNKRYMYSTYYRYLSKKICAWLYNCERYVCDQLVTIKSICLLNWKIVVIIFVFCHFRFFQSLVIGYSLFVTKDM
jgi:hypothetical protein